ncbi:MAG: adenylate kinase [Bacteroidales bacterium]|nr:adenylate kinase [Bacteroidales bacterium]
MLNIALFGPPGAGKGTQSKKLTEKYNLAYVATGDLLREEINEKTDLGMQAKEAIERGELVTDEIIVQIIENKIKMNPEANGFLFDGFPRTWVQAYILEGLLLKMNTQLSCMVCIDVPEDILIDRMIKRGETSNRSDDNIDVIKYRLKEYYTKTLPVSNFYKEKGIYFPINGVGSIDDIFKRIDAAVEETLKKEWINIVLLGYPGSGKGTQGTKLAKKYNLVYISTGKMLRSEIKKNTEIGLIAKPFMEKGTNVPDEIAIKIIEEKIKLNPDAQGFVFKGFPRTMVQAYILDGLLRKQNASVSFMFDLSVSPIEAIKRLTQRGKTENRRPYDLETETILQRLEEYENKTLPLKDYYKKHNKVVTINGSGKEDQVFSRLCEGMDKALKEIR